MNAVQIMNLAIKELASAHTPPIKACAYQPQSEEDQRAARYALRLISEGQKLSLLKMGKELYLPIVKG